MPTPKKPDPIEHCAACGKRMEDRAILLRRKYCNRVCMAQGQLSDSPSTTYLRRFRRELCESCGSESQLGVHHPDQDRTNNSPENLRTLCSSCHTRWHWENGKKPWKQRIATCGICGKPAARSGLCATHRSRLRRHGSPYLVKKKIGSAWQLVEDRGQQSGPQPREWLLGLPEGWTDLGDSETP